MVTEVKAVFRHALGHRRRHRRGTGFEIAARAAHRICPDHGAGVPPGDVLAKVRLI